MEKTPTQVTSPLRVAEAEFIISAPNLKGCPASDLPEIAIAGRSNVGKSSLINLVCNRKGLAKTSGTPGKTRLINYFRLRIEPGAHLLHLVDLPGYGYSKVGQSIRKEWGKALEEYMAKREELQGIIQLIDSRHPPTTLDKQMREWILNMGIPRITVLTKLDKLKKNDISKLRKTIVQDLGLLEDEPCILTSATERRGVEEMLQAILQVMAMREPLPPEEA